MKTTIERNTLATSLTTSVIYGYDRIKLWIDRPELPFNKSRLAPHCIGIDVLLGQMKYQARWKLKLDIFQPTIDCLRLLRDGLGNDIATILTYAENACDISATTQKKALQRETAFLASARMRYQRQPVILEDNTTTWYYGRRSGQAKASANVMALYSDKPSKLNNARPLVGAPYCFHREWRATGSAALVHIGLVSLDDLINFDHERFWDTYLRMYQLPKPTQLGRILAQVAGADSDVSGTALRKRAARWKSAHNIDGHFIMHNALLGMPELVKRFSYTSISDWLESLS